MKINHRAWSFFVVSLIYVLATVVGIAVYTMLSFPVWLNLLIADVVATVVVFIFSVVFGNASVYDPYWSVQPIVIVLCFCFTEQLNIVKMLPVIAVCLWGLRLTANWAYTFHGLTHQDWRYTQLKEQTGALYPLVNFFGIHLVPTLVVYACVMPAVFTLQSSATSWNIGCSIAFFLSLCAIGLQTASDIQMQLFRKHKTGGFIRDGLWKYSRHPNYLGEILMWWGVGLFSVFSLGFSKWYLLAGAVLNTMLFLCISIPLADGRQSKKDGFAEYKAQTHALIPIKK